VHENLFFVVDRIAKIKQMLKMDTEAVIDYKELLQNHPDYIPALLGRLSSLSQFFANIFIILLRIM